MAEADLNQSFGLVRPTLLRSLKLILDEYPDNAQILKELIQNAEDARATTVKFMYDENTYSDANLHIPEMAIFNKCPSLLVYNDKKFTPEDWHNLGQIANSVKKIDPLKVGKFGLGFKSIFHLTDCPTILSGDRFGMLDPYEKYFSKTDGVQSGFCCELSSEDFKLMSGHVSPMLNKFGYSEKCDEYPGTLFRFPLRIKGTALSDTVYTNEKVKSLIDGLTHNAHLKLLFLTNVRLLEVFSLKKGTTSPQCIRVIKCSESPLQLPSLSTEINQESFVSTIRTSNAINTSACTSKLTITSSSTEDSRKSVHSFVVCHYFNSKSIGDGFSLKDGYMPIVGCAIDMSLVEKKCYEVNGHIFVSLPLPQEGKSLTGLPIHINGYFAVSQNRRHLKWPTDEQIQKTGNKDSDYEWNKILLSKLLPICYIYALHAYRLVDINADLINLLPCEDYVDEKLKVILQPFYSMLVDQNLFKVHGGRLASLKKSYIMERESNSDHTISSVIKVFHNCRKNVVVTSDFVVKATRNLNVHLELISPVIVIDLIKSRPECYEGYSWLEKVAILQYILQCDNYSVLDGVKLLPLNTEEFTSFKVSCTTKDIVYVCDENTDGFKKIIPTLNEFLLHEKIPDGVRKSLLNCKQFKKITTDDVVRLLSDMLNDMSGEILKVDINQFPYLNKTWNNLVWKFVKEQLHGNVRSIKNIPLLCISEYDDTILNLGCLESDEVYILSEQNGDILPPDVVQFFQLLGIHVIVDVCIEVRQCLNVIGSYIFPPTVNGAVDAISKLFSRNDEVNIHEIDAALLTGFANFLASGDLKTMTEVNETHLRQIPMFKQLQGEGLISLSESKEVICTYGLPFLPQIDGIVDARNWPYKDILLISSGGFLSEFDALKKYLLPDVRSGKLGREDTEVLMKHVLKHINISNSNISKLKQMMTLLPFISTDNKPKCKLIDMNNSDRSSLKQMMSSLPFIFTDNGPKCASELFDFEDLELLTVFDKAKFPCRQTWNDFSSHLRELGLKSSNCVTLDDILGCVQGISEDIRVTKGKGASHEKKTSIILNLLGKIQISTINPSSKNFYRNAFSSIQWLPICLIRPSKYPSSLKWKSEEIEACPYVEPSRALDTSYSYIVGAVHSIVDIDSDVASLIGLQDKPSLTSIVRQLNSVTTSYRKNEKMEYLPIVNEIYCKLQNHSMAQLKGELVSQGVSNWIWHGDGFTSIDNIFFQIPIDLQPFSYSMPSEMSKYSAWLMGIGMSQKCSYPQILKKIKLAHDNKQRPSNVDYDRGLVISILKQCSVDGIKSGALLPVICDANELCLLPGEECTINDKSHYLMYGDIDKDINYIHPDLSPSIAAEFGAYALMSRLVDTDDPGLFEFQSWGQHESLTQRIKNIIKDYSDGFALPKEMIQNADDAGATEVSFLWDERENENYKDKLLHNEMKHCQGPALWVFNNAFFSEADLKNITNIGAGTKEEDVAKIGKFGLGFNAVYNITDVPSFVSDKNFVIFDPQTRYLNSVIRDKSQSGILIDLQRKHKLLKLVPDQFNPYQGILGCDLTAGKFDKGTLFRLPLRTRQQAEQSDISEDVYDKNKMETFLQHLRERINKLLLFTQNVVNVNVYHLAASSAPGNTVLLYKIQKTLVKNKIRLPFTRFAEQSHSQGGKEKLLNATGVNYVAEKQLKKGECFQSAYIGQVKITYSNKTVSNEQWLISAYCSNKTKTMKMAKQVKAMPLTMVAVKLDNHLNSVPISCANLFCHLPLPINSGLPVHVNGHFAVAANRRHLAEKTSDDISNIEALWNKTLISDSLPYAYNIALECLKHEGSSFSDILNLFPRQQKINAFMVEFHQAFYTNLVEQPLNFFYNDQGWHSFKEVEFLSQPLMESSVVNEVSVVLNEVLSERNISIAIVPNEILEEFASSSTSIKTNLKKKTWTVERFFNEAFLPYLSKMHPDMRDPLLCYALELSIENKNLATSLSQVSCIPVQNHRGFLKPNELVDPDGKCGSLYDVADGKFPCKYFLDDVPRRALRLLEMSVDNLTIEQIVERASSIANLTDKRVAYSRAFKLLSFVEGMLPARDSILQIQNTLRSIAFLPVKACPDDWGSHIAWKGESTNKIFMSPREVYSDRYEDLIGSREFLCEIKSHRVEKFLKLNRNPSIDSVLEQLGLYCACATIDSHVQRKIKAIYIHLDERLREESDIEETVKTFFASRKVCLIDDTLMSSHCIATEFSEKTSCLPYLTELPYVFRKYSALLKILDIKSKFGFKDFLDAISQMKSCQGKVDIKIGLKIIVCLAEEMKSCNTSAHDIEEQYGLIHILDRNEEWQPANCLCYHSPPWCKPVSDQIFAHEKIHFTVCELIGVKSSRENLLDSLSTDMYGGFSFGQREELTSRIRRLIKGYPADETILNEILQNADDAGATEIEIILDKNTYNFNTVIGDKYKYLQGPALVVHNDRPFKQKDIDGIQRVGLGSKEQDSATIGQFGVGFNCVYSLTDTPQILTQSGELGKKLCIFDPNCRYIHSANKSDPGRMYDVTDEFANRFPDVLKPFESSGLSVNNCTMIRLPLRSIEMAKSSKISNKPVSTVFVNDLLEKFKNAAKSTILFLKSVKEVKIYVSDLQGKKLLHRVSARMTDEDKKQHEMFLDAVKQSAIDIKRGKSIKIHKNIHQLTLEETGSSETWLVSQNAGLTTDPSVYQSITSGLVSTDLNFMPFGGVAYRQSSVPKTKKEDEKQIYCFLPLPVHTQLPVHINGHFALDDTRRCLWPDVHDGFRKQWNNLLLKDVIANAYCSLIEYVIKSMLDRSTEIVKLLPKTRREDSDYINKLVESLYDILNIQNVPILEAQRDRWFSINDCSSGKAFFFAPNLDFRASKTVKKALLAVDFPILQTPYSVCKLLEELNISVKKVNPEAVLKHFRKWRHNSSNENKPLTYAEIISILEYCRTIGEEEFYRLLNGTCLCVTQDGALRPFDDSYPVFQSMYYMLFPSCSHAFLHSEFWNFFGNAPREFEAIKDFQISDVAVFLEHHSPHTLDKGKSIPFDNNLCHWLIILWEFIVSRLKYTVGNFDLKQEEKTKIINNEIAPIAMYCVLPVRVGRGLTRLTSMNVSRYVMNFTHDEDEYDIRRFLEQLRMPEVDPLLHTKCQSPIKGILALVTCSVKYPIHVLESLAYNLKECITIDELKQVSSKLKHGEIQRVLEYLARPFVRRATSNEHAATVRALPIHQAVDGSYVTLCQHGIYIIPRDMPYEGLMESTPFRKFIVKNENNDVVSMHEMVGCAKLSIVEIYVQLILPQFDMFTSAQQIIHLTYLRDTFIDTEKNLEKEDNKVLAINLNKTQFIRNEEGLLCSPGELYDPTVDVLRVMKSRADFPEDDFKRPKWLTFLRRIGLKCTVSASELIKYATEVRWEAREILLHSAFRDIYHPSFCPKSGKYCIRRKANAIVENLYKRTDLSTSDLHILQKIPFIPTDEEVLTKLSTLCPQTVEPLVSFCGSVVSSQRNLCWSSVGVLPEWATPPWRTEDSDYYSDLNVIDTPDETAVISHCITLCNYLSEDDKALIRDKKSNDMMKIMLDIYTYLNENSCDVTRLQSSPCVFIDRSCGYFVHPRQVVINMDESKEIIPYLFRKPKYCGALEDFLQKLGAFRCTTYETYVNVLNDIKQVTANQTLHDNDLQAAIETMVELCRELTLKQKDMPKKLTVNLLTRNRILLDSSEIFYIDGHTRRRFDRLTSVKQPILLERYNISGDTPNHMGGLHNKTDVTIIDKTAFRRLVDVTSLRPLSKLVMEHLTDESKSTAVAANTEMLLEIQTKLSDPAVHELLYRCICCLYEQKSEQFEISVSEVADICCGFHIWECPNLNTRLTINSEFVEGSESNRDIFTDRSDVNGVNIYFNSSFYNREYANRVCVNELSDDLKFLDIFQKSAFKDLANYIMGQRQSSDISRLYRDISRLFNIEFQPSEMVTSPNGPPLPGSFIPICRHHLLSNSFAQFYDGEYVGYLLTDSILDNDDDATDADDTTDDAAAVFIYGRIISRCDAASTDENTSSVPEVRHNVMNTCYNVNIGSEEHVTAASYYLYKILRVDATGLNLVDPDERVLSYDDKKVEIAEIIRSACRLEPKERDRIINRLLANYVEEDDFVNYIQEVVEIAVDERSDADGHVYSIDVDTTVQLLRRRNRQRQICRAQYATVLAENSRALTQHRGGGYMPVFHTSARNPQPGESRRWFKQAKLTLQSAPNDVRGDFHSMIVLKCHLAGEQGLTAMVLMRNADRYDPRNSKHSLTHLVCYPVINNCPGDIIQLATELQTLAKQRNNLLYPNTLMAPGIPHTAYNERDSERAQQIAESLLEKVHAYLLENDL